MLNICKKSFFVFVFILTSSTLLAQYPNWSYLATGLHIRKIAEEGNYLWAATESGLVQYNKQNGQKTVFDKTNSGLQSNLINYVYVDAQGTKWIGTRESGLYKFSGGVWTNYNISNCQLPENNIQTIVPDTSGSLWIGTYGGGLVKYKNDTWTIYDSLNTGKQIQYIYSLAYDMYGYLWVGTAGDGIFRFDGVNEWVPYNTDNNNVLQSDVVKAIVVDAEGNKWFGTESGEGGGLYKFDGSMFTLYSTGSFSLNVYAIAFDNTNNLWVGTYGGGIAKLTGTSWTIFNTSNSGLTDNAIKCFYFDAQGVKWIGTEHKGLVKYSGTMFQAINLGILPNTFVFSMAKQNDGTKWIGTKNFLTRYQNGTVESIDLNDFLVNPSPGLPPNFNVWSIAFDAQGYKWIGTYDGGLIRFSPLNIPKVFNLGNSGIPSDNVYSIVIDKQDVKWIGTSNGLAKYDGTLWKTYNTSNSPLPNNYISSIVIDKQNKMWIATTNGVARFDGVNWSVYTTANGLPNNYTFSVAVDSQNNKWIGTSAGLAKFDGAGWTVYNTGNSGLPQNVVQFVQCDASGNVWVGTGGYVLGGGITKFDGTNWVTYNSANSGLSGDQVSSFFVDENGKKWIGTFDNGVSIFNDNPAPVGSIVITAPAAGAVVVAGTSYQVQWQSTNVSNVKIEYSIDNGNTWQSIVQSVAASAGSYNWQVPALTNTQGLIKISDVANPAVYKISPAFQIAGSYCKDVSVSAGWNLVASPLQAGNMLRTALFPTANSPLYGYVNGYVQNDTLATGNGYWLRFPSAAVAQICGTQPNGSTISLRQGWNLIAPFDMNLLVTDLVTVPANILSSPFYSYAGSYQVAQGLTPGKGYWVRSTQAGTLHFTSKAAGKSNYIPQVKQDWMTITITDAAGNSTVLHLAKTIENSAMFALPPAPPEGIFDVRFTDDSRAAVEGENVAARIQGAQYPVTLSIDKGILQVSDLVDGKQFAATLQAGNPIRLENPALTTLGMHTMSAPKEFTLLQNYPNPFNPSTRIAFSLPESEQVTLTVYNQLGEKVAVLLSGIQDAGYHQVEWNAAQISSGVYLYELKSAKHSAVRKLLLMK